MPKQIIDLDTLVGDAGEVVLGGDAFPVLPLDGAAYKTIVRVRGKKVQESEAMELMYAIAKRVCPSLGDRVDALNLSQVGAILKIAGSHVEEVEQHPKSSPPKPELVNEVDATTE
jgi:hypothetical protein